MWTDAGYAGTNTHSQSGLVVTWAGSIVVWRSSRQSVSALSTAEAELYSATLGWQIVEGLRHLITNYGVRISRRRVFIDNQAALTIAKCGANWRTRYFVVRGHRLHEEYNRGAIELLHCPTKGMIADALTNMSTAPVLELLHPAMEGTVPSHISDNPPMFSVEPSTADLVCVLSPDESSEVTTRCILMESLSHPGSRQDPSPDCTVHPLAESRADNGLSVRNARREYLRELELVVEKTSVETIHSQTRSVYPADSQGPEEE